MRLLIVYGLKQFLNLSTCMNRKQVIKLPGKTYSYHAHFRGDPGGKQQREKRPVGGPRVTEDEGQGAPLRQDPVSDQVTAPVGRKGPFTTPGREDFRRMLGQGLLSPPLPFSKQML